MTFVKNLMEKDHTFLSMDFECSYEVLLHQKYILVHSFDNEKTALLKFQRECLLFLYFF